jgi:phosphatidylinositol-bisphosphatase
MKIEHQQKVNIVDYNIVKTGFGGQYGNKGYIIMTLKCFDTYVSVACVHFEAGEENNKTRFENLKQLLNNNIKLEEDRNIIFKDVDYWIILGDTNFRVEMGYKDALLNIQNNNLNVILKDDQFYKYKNSENEFNIINEGIINFNPTYKFIKGENKYEYDEKKIRIPSWTDRIFYPKKNGIKNIMYNSISNLFQSDHKPVIAVFDIFYKNS